MPPDDDLISMLAEKARNDVRAQLKRHAAAGHRMSRDQACKLATDQLQERILRLASDADARGSHDSADAFREFAVYEVPQIVREASKSIG